MNVSFVRDSFEGCALAVLVFYAVLGAFRPTLKCVVSLILLPLVMVSYLLVPIGICQYVFVPKNLFAFVGLLSGSFILVTLGKWVLSLFLTFVFRGKPSEGFNFFSRISAIVISVLEGVCVLIVACWMLDFFDRLGGSKMDSFYESLNHNPIYTQVAVKSPLYRLEIARKVKYVLLAHKIPEALDKVQRSPVFKKLMDIDAIHKIQEDRDLQEMIAKEQWFSVLKNPLLYDFMKSEKVFSILKSSDFVEACRLSLPGYILDEVMGKS